MSTNETTVSFFLFSCLSISIESLKNKEADHILMAVIKRAYRDAASRVLSVKGNDPRNSNDNNPDSIIAQSVNCLEPTSDYDKWHCDLCKKLIKAYSNCSDKEDKQGNNLEFRFGIAQKWINMTMKYMVLLCDICSDSELKNSKFYQNYGDVIETHRKSFHAPVDRYIINAVWEYSQVVLPLKADGEKRSNKYKNPSDYVKAWSKWEKEDYCKFQKSLREFIHEKYPDKTVLAWENEAWILEAETINK